MAKKPRSTMKPALEKKPKVKKQTEIKTIIQKTMQNTITISGVDLLELFEDSGLIFDKTGKVKVASTTRNSYSRYNRENKTLNINPTSNYNITCSKKSNTEENSIINKPKSKNNSTEEIDVVELL